MISLNASTYRYDECSKGGLKIRISAHKHSIRAREKNLHVSDAKELIKIY